MLSADHVFSSASGLTGPPQGQGGPTDAARKLQDLAAQVRGGGHIPPAYPWPMAWQLVSVHVALQGTARYKLLLAAGSQAASLRQGGFSRN
jgi:hypothetical protein